MSLTTPPIADTRVRIERAQLEELARTAPTRRRQLVRLIDRAIDQCERANLAAAGDLPSSVYDRPAAPVPPAVAALLAWLQLEARESSSAPSTAVEAHCLLFRLQMPYLCGGASDEDDQVADVEDLVSEATR